MAENVTEQSVADQKGSVNLYPNAPATQVKDVNEYEGPGNEPLTAPLTVGGSTVEEDAAVASNFKSVEDTYGQRQPSLK